MTLLYQRIVEISTKRNITFYAIEKGASLTKSSLRNWADSMPSSDRLLRVANFLDVSVDYLLGNTDYPQSHKNKEDFSSAAKELVKAVDKMTKSAEIAKSDIFETLEKFRLLSLDNTNDLSE